MKKNKRDFFLIGAHDSFNFGDDLIFVSILHFFKTNLKLNPEDINLFTQRNAFSLDKLKWDFDYELIQSKDFIHLLRTRNRAFKQKKISKFIRICMLVIFMMLFFMHILLYRFLNLNLFAFYKKSVDFYKNLDVIYYIGGGYITDRWIRRMFFEFIQVKIAKYINPDVKIIGTGMGVGPFKHSFSFILLKSLLNEFDFLFLREKISLDIVNKLVPELNAKYLGDDVILIFPLLKRLQNESLKRLSSNSDSEGMVSINLKKFPDYKYDLIKNKLQGFIQYFKRKNRPVEYFCFGRYPGPNDRKLINLIDSNRKGKTLMDKVHDPYEEGCKNFLENLSSSALGLGFAYHFIIVLSILSVPLIAGYCGNYYEQKIKGSTEVFAIPNATINIFDFKKKNTKELLKDLDRTNHYLIKVLFAQMVKEYTGLWKKILGNV